MESSLAGKQRVCGKAQSAYSYNQAKADLLGVHCRHSLRADLGTRSRKWLCLTLYHKSVGLVSHGVTITTTEVL